jgi:hypothetical protein
MQKRLRHLVHTLFIVRAVGLGAKLQLILNCITYFVRGIGWYTCTTMSHAFCLKVSLQNEHIDTFDGGTNLHDADWRVSWGAKTMAFCVQFHLSCSFLISDEGSTIGST